MLDSEGGRGMSCSMKLLGHRPMAFHDLDEREGHMFVYVLVLAGIIGFPISSFAQFVDKGEYVVVARGTRLCASVAQGVPSAMLDPEKLFWRVASDVRTNGTQTVAPFVFETAYDRKSGETTINARKYDQDYATLFKRDPEYQGRFLMVSPEDNQVEATVELCGREK